MAQEAQDKPSKPHPLMPPRWMIHVLIILVVLSWVPFALTLSARNSRSRQPRVHLFQDMDAQPKLKAQAPNAIFDDGRAMRPRIPGTVRHDTPPEVDDHYYRGMATDDEGRPVEITREGATTAEFQWLAGYPEQVTVSMELLRTGQTNYVIYCAPCHGESGEGTGRIHEVAQRVETDGWVQPANLHSRENDGSLTFGEPAYPNGELFHVITHGRGQMMGYGSQINLADRWAIVAYVRALQLSQDAAFEDVPREHWERLR